MHNSNENKSYRTRQRNVLLDFFKENKDSCFLAKELVRREEITMGEATVYRCLSKFVSEGLLKKFISPGDEGAYFQYNENKQECGNHFHLKCMQCGVLIHMDCSFMKEMATHMLQEHGFLVDNSKTTFYGMCKQCRSGKESK